jgi:transposase InsO family protein
VVTPGQPRAAAQYLCQEHEVSQRRAAAVLGRARATLRYTPKERGHDKPLIRAIKRLARKHLRWGYRRIFILLEREGWDVNIKRVHRLWKQLGLRRTTHRKPESKLGPKVGTSANSCVNQPALFKNDVWTYDFIADRTTGGRTLKWLTLVDEYTRECLALPVDYAVCGGDVRRVLARVIGRRGAPRRIRSDNGSEFIGEALSSWLPAKGAKPIPVAPGSPWENGYIESFNSRFRDEFLEVEEFESAPDAKEKGEWFRREYNAIRPHSSLDYKTPREFGDECDLGLHGQPPKTKKPVSHP